jgi:hypothetical protein
MAGAGQARRLRPPFERIGPKTLRYRRDKARKWLDQRSHLRTSEYKRAKVAR